jgi:hypothetical protein
VFEVSQGLVTYKDPNASEGESQVVQLLDFDHPALVSIDLELQLVS